MRTALDLLSQYAVHHRDRRNIVTQFVGVPTIVLALGVLLARPAFSLFGVELSPAWLLFPAVALWYLTRHLTLGAATSLGVGGLLLVAEPLAAGTVGGWLGWGLGLLCLGWAIQLVGHYYEGRQLRFADDLGGLVAAPMFVTAEVLFLFGWNRPLLDAIEQRAGPTVLRDLAHPA